MTDDAPLRLLRHLCIVDDSDIDAELVEARIRDFSPALERVTRFSSQEGLDEKLAVDRPDLLICDFHMAGDDTPATLRAVRGRLPLLPILVMSGLVGEELAAEVIKAGASDFVPKSRSERLRQVLEHLLREAAFRHRQAELSRQIELQRRELEAIYNQAPVGMWKLDATGRLYDVNLHGRRMMGGLVTADLDEFGVFEGWWYDSGERIKDHEWPAAVAATQRVPVPMRLFRIRTFTGDIRVFDCGATPLAGADGEYLGTLIVATDETESVAVQERLAHAEQAVRRASVAQLDRLEDHMASLSRELHDDIGQMLALVKLRLAEAASRQMPARQRLSGLVETTNLVEMAIARLRQICTDLRPSELIDFGLAEGLRNLAQAIARSAGLKVELLEEGQARQINKTVGLAIYRVAQQALTNVIQHADATAARMVLSWSDAELTLVVQDNGKGSAEPASDRVGTGVKSMAERIELLGGSFQIDFSPGQGAMVRACIPCRDEAPRAETQGQP